MKLELYKQLSYGLGAPLCRVNRSLWWLEHWYWTECDQPKLVVSNVLYLFSSLRTPTRNHLVELHFPTGASSKIASRNKSRSLAWTAIPHNHHWLQAFAALFSEDFPIYQWSNFSTWRAFPKLICAASIRLFQFVKEWSGWLVIFNPIWRKNISRHDFDSAYFDPAYFDPASSIFYWLTPFNSRFVLQSKCFVSHCYFLLVVELNLFFW